MLAMGPGPALVLVLAMGPGPALVLVLAMGPGPALVLAIGLSPALARGSDPVINTLAIGPLKRWGENEDQSPLTRSG